MKILFTGGATGGHFYPLLAVAKELRKLAEKEKIFELELFFMAPTPYDERLLFENNISYLWAPSGKIRRYFSIANVLDGFKTMFGVLRAIVSVFIMYPDVVLGKGGYGSFPALIAARVFRLPIIIHESDSSPGRVNAWAGKFADRVAISYPEAARYFSSEKTALTGCPIREELKKPIAEGAYEFLKLDPNIPVILILGGSQGARTINESVLDVLPKLLHNFQIIHQTGKENFEEVSRTAAVVLEKHPWKNRYVPFGYLNALSLRMASGVARAVVSRAGSTIFEIAQWGLPSIIIPIPQDVSHDQTGNAFAYARTGAAAVIEQHNLTPSILELELRKILDHPDQEQRMKTAASAFASPDAAKKIAEEIFRIALSHEA